MRIDAAVLKRQLPKPCWCDSGSSFFFIVLKSEGISGKDAEEEFKYKSLGVASFGETLDEF